MSEASAEEPRWVGLWWADSVWAWGAAYVARKYEEAPPLVSEVRSIVEENRSDQFSLLETIQVLEDLRVATDRVLREVVAQARSESYHHSWSRIGDALGVGRTAAQKRFGKGLSTEHLDYLKYELESTIELLKNQRARTLEEPEEGYEEEEEQELKILTRKIDILESRLPITHQQLSFYEHGERR